jgi:hypothetical protein
MVKIWVKKRENARHLHNFATRGLKFCQKQFLTKKLVHAKNQVSTMPRS